MAKYFVSPDFHGLLAVPNGSVDYMARIGSVPAIGRPRPRGGPSPAEASRGIQRRMWICAVSEHAFSSGALHVKVKISSEYKH